ncbi:MAG TPA: molybdopterin-dependent oxidoreductase, partial [bacterium]|nr:molybdopterin-dependent oxidoreductase [bacterium]
MQTHEFAQQPQPPSGNMVTYSTSVCTHNCPDGCGMRVGVEGGRIVSISGDPDHPITRGFLCGKVNRYAERVYSAGRVLTPLKRVGAKGQGRFVPVTWDEALDEIARRFRHVIATHGAEAILRYSYSGTVGRVSMNIGEPLFNALGASRLDRTICSTQAVEGQRYTTGAGLAVDLEQVPQAGLIILWGSNAVSTNIHLLPLIRQALKGGAQLVVIDPQRNRTARQAGWHLAIRPGTDIALALGLMREIIAQGLHHREFVARYTLGFAELEEACAPYTPETVAGITGLAATDVVRLAHAYGTTQASLIRMGLGLTRRRNGGMTVRTISCLPALTGAWEVPGCGFLRQGWGNASLNIAYLTQPRPQDPPARTINMIRLGEALLDVKDPPVKALYVYNSNPAAVVPEQARVHAGLAREDLFLAVHEQMLTDTTDYADIVLPATTMLEQEELGSASGHWYVQYSRPAIAPLGEAKSNLDAFRLLAQRLGIRHPVYECSFQDLTRQLLKSSWTPPQGWDWDALWAGRPQRLQPPAQPWREGKLKTASGKFEFFSAAMRALGLSPVPAYEPSPEGHLDNEVKRRYPLQFCCPHAHHFINSSFADTPTSLRLEHGPRLRLHPVDAAARGLVHGQACRVFNDRGACRLTVDVTEYVLPGVC